MAGPQDGDDHRRRWTWSLLPLACGVVSAAVLASRGWSTRLVYSFWQVLPREALLEAPLESLWYCHQQPPGISALLALLEAVGRRAAVDPALPASLLFLGISCWTLVAFCWLALRLTGSAVVAGLVPLLLILDPSWYQSMNYVFYTPLVAALLGGLLVGAARWAERPGPGWMAVMACCLLLLAFTRTIWHPVFGVLVVGGAVVWQRRRSGVWGDARRNLAVGLLVVVLPAGLWMAKNERLFGHFAFTSWSGLNLGGERTARYGRTREFEPELVRSYYGREQLERYRRIPVLALAQKTLGVPAHLEGLRTNMNHYVVPALSAADARDRLAAFRAEPVRFVERCALHLASFDLPTWSNPYMLDPASGRLRQDLAGAYGWYPALHAQLVHGAWLEDLVALRLGEVTLRPSVFLAVLLPLALVVGVREGLRRPSDERGLVLLSLVLTYLWLLLVTLLVDGRESARMRREVEPVYLVLLVHAGWWAWSRVSAVVRTRRAGRPRG